LVIEGGTFGQLLFQSSSINLFVNNARIGILNGTPQKAIISNSTIGVFVAGTLHFGRTAEISCTNCNIGAFKNPPGGSLDNNVDTRYTMSGGVIIVPKSQGPASWAVPGANAIFALYNGAMLTQGTPFQVTEVTHDADNTYIQTTLAGEFPLLPKDPNHGLSIYGHPAPKFTCTSCTGSLDAVDLAQAPAAAPIFSYSKRTYDGSVPNPPTFTMWGRFVKISVNVTKAYTGARATLTLDPIGTVQVVSGSTSTTYNVGTIDLKVAKERIIYPTFVSGVQSGDSLSAPGEAIWFGNRMGPRLSANISAEPSSVWPSFTIEVTTDHGVVNP
jgi:hypothetical protein